MKSRLFCDAALIELSAPLPLPVLHAVIREIVGSHIFSCRQV
jgi:hypothetical protein